MLKSGIKTSTAVSRTAARAGVHAGRTFSRAISGFTAKLDAGQRRALLTDPEVVAVVPDEIVHLAAQTIPTGGQAESGRRQSTVAFIDGSDQRVDADVAIVDTGVGPHPDLNIAGGYNCSSSNRSAWADNNGHGTHVAGTVGALDNDFGVVGRRAGRPHLGRQDPQRRRLRLPVVVRLRPRLDPRPARPGDAAGRCSRP